MKGWARLGGGGALTQDNQDRPGLATRGMKKRVPLQLPKMKGCQSVTNAGWKRFKCDIPPSHCCTACSYGNRSPAEPSTFKRQQKAAVVGQRQGDKYRLMGRTCSLT